MDYLQKLFSRSLLLEKPKPNGLSSSFLAELPVDILLYIMEYLPAESGVAFSLSCRQLKALLFKQSLFNVTISSSSRLALLELLALDLPNEIACSACMRMHSMTNLLRYSNMISNKVGMVNQYESSRIPACVSRDRNQNTWFISHRLGTTSFKMAVKRWHQYPECSEILKTMSSATTRSKQMRDFVWLSKEECRIVQGHLMHRLQSVCILHKILRAMPLNFGPCLPPDEICPHISIKKNEHNIGAGVRRCRECHTEYRIDLGCYENNKLAVFFTRWKDLGTDPESKLWLQHLPSRRPLASHRSCFNRRDRAQSSARGHQGELWPQDGDISSAFGDGRNFKFDSMLEKQKYGTYLRIECSRYRQPALLMKQADKSTQRAPIFSALNRSSFPILLVQSKTHIWRSTEPVGSDHGSVHNVNIYTSESSWKLPLEPVYSDIKPSQNVSGVMDEIFPTQQGEIQTSPGGLKSSTVLVSPAFAQQAAQESYFPQQAHVQTAIYASHEAVPVLFFPPTPGPSKSQTLQVANQVAVQNFPPPPALPQGQTLSNQSEQNETPLYFPLPPQISVRSSESSQLQINFLPPPPRTDTIVHPQAGDLAQTPQATVSTHFQARPAPPSSRLRPRSFIVQMEMMKIQISDQSQIYGARAMETKLGSKVSIKVGKFIPTKTGSRTKETDPLLDTEATPLITKEEKKPWDNRTEEEKRPRIRNGASALPLEQLW